MISKTADFLLAVFAFLFACLAALSIAAYFKQKKKNETKPALTKPKPLSAASNLSQIAKDDTDGLILSTNGVSAPASSLN